MRFIATLALLGALVVAGCGSGAAGGGGGKADTITIAYQPGIGYAPLLIMKQNKWLEKDLPGRKIVYKRLDSGSAIRDGMLSGDINVGAGGFGPFLVGWDKGIDWKILSPMEDMDLWLMAKNAKYKSLADYKDGGKIAMPAPDSIQAVVLRKGAQKELGDARALDDNIVSLGHPDGLQALLSGQLAGHLTSPPFEFDEQDKGAHKVLSSYELFGGPHTFNSVYMRQGFYSGNKDVADAIFKEIQRGIQLLRDNPDEAAQILSAESEGQNSAAQFKGYITHEGVEYTNTPHGFVKLGEFMKQIGLTSKAPGSVDEITFDQLHGMSGAN